MDMTKPLIAPELVSARASRDGSRTAPQACLTGALRPQLTSLPRRRPRRDRIGQRMPATEEPASGALCPKCVGEPSLKYILCSCLSTVVNGDSRFTLKFQEITMHYFKMDPERLLGVAARMRLGSAACEQWRRVSLNGVSFVDGRSSCSPEHRLQRLLGLANAS